MLDYIINYKKNNVSYNKKKLTFVFRLLLDLRYEDTGTFGSTILPLLDSLACD
jgi:hypothetical protein